MLNQLFIKNLGEYLRILNIKYFLVNEFRTSKLCNYCNNILEHFLKKENKNTNSKDKIEIYHGLLRCQSVTSEFKIIYNKDKNAIQNMLYIVKSLFDKGHYPSAFCRVINS